MVLAVWLGCLGWLPGQSPKTITLRQETLIYSGTNQNDYVTDRLPSGTQIQFMELDRNNSAFALVKIPSPPAHSLVKADEVKKPVMGFGGYKTKADSIHVYYPKAADVAQNAYAPLVQARSAFSFPKTVLTIKKANVQIDGVLYHAIHSHPDEVRYALVEDVAKSDPEVKTGMNGNSNVPPSVAPSLSLPSQSVNPSLPTLPNSYSSTPSSLPPSNHWKNEQGGYNTQPSLPGSSSSPSYSTPSGYENLSGNLRDYLNQAEQAYYQSDWGRAETLYQQIAQSNTDHSVRMLALNRLEFIRERPSFVRQESLTRNSGYSAPTGPFTAREVQLPMTSTRSALPASSNTPEMSNGVTAPPTNREPALPGAGGTSTIPVPPASSTRQDELRPGTLQSQTLPGGAEPQRTPTFIPSNPNRNQPIQPTTNPNNPLTRKTGRLIPSNEPFRFQPTYFLVDSQGVAICKVIAWTNSGIRLDSYVRGNMGDIVELEGHWRTNIPNETKPQLNVTRIISVNGAVQGARW